MQIHTVSQLLHDTYGGKVLKLSLSSGCTCPNRDGTKGTGGCSFCSEGGSGEFAASFAPIPVQICQAKALVDHKFPAGTKGPERKYIAYFQSFSNTYGDPDKLERMFREVLDLPEIVILSVATRPDCLSREMTELLAALNKIKPVWVELGLQTIHDETAASFGRGYALSEFNTAYHRLKQASLTVILHMILGLPGESEELMLSSMRYLSGLTPPPDGIKIQMLQVLKGTKLAAQYEQNPFPLLSMEEYTDLVVKCLRILPKEIVIHRLTGDPPRSLLIAPGWCADKKRVLGMLQKKITESI